MFKLHYNAHLKLIELLLLKKYAHSLMSWYTPVMTPGAWAAITA